jgi:hypothetical protein
VTDSPYGVRVTPALVHEQEAYLELVDEARSLGVPTSLDDPRSPRRLDELRALTAREILRREYGRSRNMMTPDVLKIGKLGRDAAYELSCGSGFEPGTTIYGVSVVRMYDGTTERDYEASGCFASLDEATAHVERLRKEAHS